MKANTRAAALEANNIKLQYQINTIKDRRPRRRVYIDPNSRFTDIENIRATIHQSETTRAHHTRQRRDINDQASAEAAAAAAAATLESMCNSWQLMP